MANGATMLTLADGFQAEHRSHAALDRTPDAPPSLGTNTGIPTLTDPSDIAARRATPRRRRTHAVGIVLSLAAHLALLPLLFMAAGESPAFLAPPDEFEAISIDLIPPPKPPMPDPAPEPDPEPPAKAAAKSAEPPPTSPMLKPRPTPPPAPRTRAARPVPPNVETVVANLSPAPTAFVGLTDAELGGATVAGSGSGTGSGTGAGSGSGSGAGAGGSCDMVKRIQDALRADPDIRQAALQAHRALGSRRALLMWNGDWLPSPGQVGRGLAGVRQAIALEVAFAPPSCREQPMRGLALVTLGDSPDSPRIALGAARWRWSELAKGR